MFWQKGIGEVLQEDRPEEDGLHQVERVGAFRTGKLAGRLAFPSVCVDRMRKLQEDAGEKRRRDKECREVLDTSHELISHDPRRQGDGNLDALARFGWRQIDAIVVVIVFADPARTDTPRIGVKLNDAVDGKSGGADFRIDLSIFSERPIKAADVLDIDVERDQIREPLAKGLGECTGLRLRPFGIEGNEQCHYAGGHGEKRQEEGAVQPGVSPLLDARQGEIHETGECRR